MNYKDIINKDVLNYFNVLNNNDIDYLNNYICVETLLKQQYISMTCASYYSNLFNIKSFYSSLDHSIGVSLIVNHFTNDKKQTISGLYHDIATPVFKHCIDFLNGDSVNQESTEDLTTTIIKESKDIMALLKRDNIKLEEINDYHKYPIADNDTPKLSSDRLEYTLANALFTYKLLNIDDIKEIYNDLIVTLNEEGNPEISFKSELIALKFFKVMCKLSIIYREDKTRYSMQFIADIVKNLYKDNIITINDLYTLKESEIIDIIKKSKYSKQFDIWLNAKEVETSAIKPDCYYVKVPSKVRYINPLCNGKRLTNINKEAEYLLEDNLKYDMNKYVYIRKVNYL